MITGFVILIVCIIYATIMRFTRDEDEHGDVFTLSDDAKCLGRWLADITHYTAWALKTGRWSQAKSRYGLSLGKCGEKIFKDVDPNQLLNIRRDARPYAGYQNLNRESDTYGLIKVVPVEGKVSSAYPLRDVRGWPFFVYLGMLDKETGRIHREWLYDNTKPAPAGWSLEVPRRVGYLYE